MSVDTILRHLRILKRHGRKVDASLPPSMLEDIADADDVDGVVSTETLVGTTKPRALAYRHPCFFRAL